MDDLTDYNLDDGFDHFEQTVYYEVSLCFTFMDMDDCITFEMVADGDVEDDIALVESVIDGYNGISQMEDGTIVNLKQFVNAFVVKLDDDTKNNKVNSRFTLLH